MMKSKSSLLAVAALAMSWTSAATFAQAPPGLGLSAKAEAPIDLTGYWVSVVTEDWRYRMLTAPKGDYYSIPLTPEARKVADTWDAAKDVAQGKQCMAYGAPAIMRQPSRVHIGWDTDSTLKVEIDAGKQTRWFAFGAPRQPAGKPTLEGTSVAQWQSPQITRFYTSKISAQDPDPVPRTNASGFRSARRAQAWWNSQGGHHTSEAWLPANNGVPYSGKAVLTEYYDIHKTPARNTW